MSGKIKNLIFDLGGILLEIDFKTANDAFGKMGVDNVEELYWQPKGNKLFQNLEKGFLSEEDFYKGIIEIAGINIESEKIKDAWAKIIRDFYADRIKVLEGLKGKYRVFLLSNTNDIHYQYYMRKFNEDFGYDFSSLFEKAYYSHQIAMIKPDHEIFQYVLNENNLLANETIFIDDNEANIIAAKELGIHTWWLTETPNFEKELFEKINQD